MPRPPSSGATPPSISRSSPRRRACARRASTGSSRRSAAETDLILVTTMRFDDRAALDAGLGSDAMRAAGRNLREIAPGLATLLVLEDRARNGGGRFPGVDTV